LARNRPPAPLLRRGSAMRAGNAGSCRAGGAQRNPPAGAEKNGGFRSASPALRLTRHLGDGRDPLFSRLERGSVGPGLRREDGVMRLSLPGLPEALFRALSKPDSILVRPIVRPR